MIKVKLMRLLLVEDDLDLGRALQRVLRDELYDVVWVRTLSDAELQLVRDIFVCVLLDINLPDGEGFQLLRAMRAEKSAIPIIVMTARETLDDRLIAFNSGADDYVIKPFAIPELLARVAAVIRRASGFCTEVWVLGDIEFDRSRRLAKVAGNEVLLTPRELSLLEQLIRAPNRVVSRTVLLESIWPVHEEPSDASLDVLVHSLRKKISSEQLKTVRGIGYMLSS
jgi:two-component system, OmpR family, response regulator QseB